MNHSPPRPPGTAKLPDAVHIREYRDSDESALIDLLRELQSAELPHNSHLKAPDEIGSWYVERLRENCATMDGVILMAVGSGGITGCAVLYQAVQVKGEEEERSHQYALVSELVVTCRARGQGIGKALLAACEQRARLVARDELCISVLAANTGAYRLYHQMGFADTRISMKKTIL